MKCKKSGFTVVELLTAVGILALLIGLLIPALNTVRRTARETKQKAQFTTIELALTAFKNDYGDYPPSDFGPPFDYCGAQKLAEALLGWDLLGFHPKSNFRSDGHNLDGVFVYDTSNPVLFDQRGGSYLELATADAFRLGNISVLKPGLFNNTGPLAPDTFVICDVFGVRKITMVKGVDPVTGQPVTVTKKAGAPILYYKANSSKKSMNPAVPTAYNNQIYNADNNLALIELGTLTWDGRPGKPHKLGLNSGSYFYNPAYKIIDPKVAARPWPYRPDSYILISAGADGLYGTGDDICNFAD